MSDDRGIPEERLRHEDEGGGNRNEITADTADEKGRTGDGESERNDDAEGGSNHGDHHDHDHDHGHPGRDHDHHATDVETVSAAVITISSTRTLDEDPAGDAIEGAFEGAGHEVLTRELVADEYDDVQASIDDLVDREDVDVVVTTGGTGITPDDVTVEAANPLFTKELPGFGELFRRRSYGEVGARIVATRASAGVVSDVPVFCLPGSANAARLGSEIVTDVCGHLAGLAKRDEENH